MMLNLKRFLMRYHLLIHWQILKQMDLRKHFRLHCLMPNLKKHRTRSQRLTRKLIHSLIQMHSHSYWH
jgi:hypothetical protein